MKLATILFFLMFTTINMSAQNTSIEPPTEGNAVVYFVRYSTSGFFANFSLFDKKKYLGKFKGTNYLRYECEPGRKLFWVRSENLDYMEADLKPGGIYIIEVAPRIGMIKPAAKLKIVDYSNKSKMKWIHKTIEKWPGVSFSNEELLQHEEKIKPFINEAIRKIYEKRKTKRKKKFISKDMTYPFSLE